MIISRKKNIILIYFKIYNIFLPYFQINYSFTHRFRYSVTAFEDYKHVATTREVEILMPSYSPPNNEKKSHFPSI
jgi:hypothetical protein